MLETTIAARLEDSSVREIDTGWCPDKGLYLMLHDWEDPYVQIGVLRLVLKSREEWMELRNRITELLDA